MIKNKFLWKNKNIKKTLKKKKKKNNTDNYIIIKYIINNELYIICHFLIYD